MSDTLQASHQAYLIHREPHHTTYLAYPPYVLSTCIHLLTILTFYTDFETAKPFGFEPGFPGILAQQSFCTVFTH